MASFPAYFLCLLADLLLLVVGGLACGFSDALRHWPWVAGAAQIRVFGTLSYTLGSLSSLPLLTYLLIESWLLATLLHGCAAVRGVIADMEEAEEAERMKLGCSECRRRRRGPKLMHGDETLNDLEMRFLPSAPTEDLLYP